VQVQEDLDYREQNMSKTGQMVIDLQIKNEKGFEPIKKNETASERGERTKAHMNMTAETPLINTMENS